MPKRSSEATVSEDSEDHVPPQKQARADVDKVNEAIKKMRLHRKSMEEVLGADKSGWPAEASKWLAHDFETEVGSVIASLESVEKEMRRMRYWYHESPAFYEDNMQAWDEESEGKIMELCRDAKYHLDDVKDIREMLTDFEECMSSLV